jgi:hypothetical protein
LITTKRALALLDNSVANKRAFMDVSEKSTGEKTVFIIIKVQQQGLFLRQDM